MNFIALYKPWVDFSNYARQFFNIAGPGALAPWGRGPAIKVFSARNDGFAWAPPASLLQNQHTPYSPPENSGEIQVIFSKMV